MRITLPDWTVPIALLVLSILSFGLLLPSLGFYWDDWPSILIARVQGLHGFQEFFNLDRPTTFISYVLLVPLLGMDPLRWQIFTLLLRWLTAVLLWWTLRKLWPAQYSGDLPAWAAVLFVVYPVFHQQPIALTYHQVWIEYTLYVLSIGAMIAALRQPRRYVLWTIIAVGALVGNFLISEYFLGVEFARVVILWLVIRQQKPQLSLRQSIRRTMLHWLPYLAALLAYLAWRFVFLDLPGEDRNAPVLLTNLIHQPLSALLALAQMALQDVSHIVVTNWYVTFQPDIFDLTSQFNLLILGLSVLGALLTALYLGHLYNPRSLNLASEQGVIGNSLQYARLAVILGALLVILAPLPAWVTERQVIVGAYSDRLAIPAMMGASLLLAGLVAWLVRGRMQQILVISLLIGLAIGSNTRIANDYRWASIQQNRFYWQLYWRAPDIQPGTAVFAYAEVLPKTGLYSTASGINLIYAQPSPSGEMPYWFFSLSRQFGYRLPALLNGIPLENTFRQFTFHGSSHNSLIIFFEPGEADCLRLPTRQDALDPALEPLVVQALPITNLARIRPEAREGKAPSADIFGPEPEHGWCYFFEKADLARQNQDWQQVVSLGDQAIALGYTPKNDQSNTPQEWMPFLEGYASAGRWEEAESLTRDMLDLQPKMVPRLCAAWSKISKQFHAESQAAGAMQEIGCGP